MDWLSWTKTPFHFSHTPVTVLTVIIYALIFESVLYTDELFDVPKNTKGLNVDRAYADLHQITTRPHPYISHANDDVRAYLLSQLESIAAQHDHVHLSDDLTPNASYVGGGVLGTGAPIGVYFEGTNILVKIDGTDTPLADPEGGHDGVLFSVHYDSVSTAPGATDDGISVVTLLELVRYLAAPEHRPRRTAVFFWNNGEEDGLNGAYLYWKHPWSNLTATFLNLEGAAAGGRPILFRSNSRIATRAYASKDISHLQADVLVGDAFKRGVVRSGTDYQVFTAGLKDKRGPMFGLDVAFYKNRAFYHTPRDSIPGMGYAEGKKALWAMMETTRGAGLALLNNDDTVGDDGQPGVYFDLFRTKLVLFSLKALFVTNIVLLVIGPIVILALLTLVVLATKSRSGQIADENIPASNWTKVKKAARLMLGWGRFWIALLFGILANAGLVAGFVNLNPYVVHAHLYVVLFTFLSLSYVAITGPLQVLQRYIPTSPSSQKLVVLLEHYFLTWVLLVVANVQVHRHQLGGVYWITAWNLFTWLALGVALAEGAIRGRKGGERGHKAGLDLSIENDYDETNGSGRRLVRGIRYDASEQQHENGQSNAEPEQAEESEAVETEPTEITPLMHQHRRMTETGSADPKYDEYGWWILQLLLAVPVVATLVFQIEYLLVQALMNTLVDGSSVLVLYSFLSVLSLLIFLPLAPFAHRLHGFLTTVVLVVFALMLIASWTMFPFSEGRPFKVFFRQEVEITSSDSDARVSTILTGLPGYVNRYIIQELPSSWGKDVQCTENAGLKSGLVDCRWDSELLPSPGGDNSREGDKWLDVRTTRLNDTSGMIYVQGTNTRGCRLYFDKPINYYKIHDSEVPSSDATGQFLPGYEMPAEGIKELRLWSREWEKGFRVEFGWDAEDDGHLRFDSMEGRAGCEWEEYASASAGGSAPLGTTGLIPALEEVKAFLPLWAQPSKTMVGLVEAWTRFSL